MNIKLIKQTFLITAVLVTVNSFAQKTIDITSSFKPYLKPSAKINFSASPITGDTSRPTLRYQIPVQNMLFSFSPAPLKPMAYAGDSLLAKENFNYAKFGLGTYYQPVFDAGLSFGDGIKTVGAVTAYYRSGKGKIFAQQYGKLGVNATGVFQSIKNHELKLSGGLNSFNTYKYGFAHATDPKKDTLKQQFTGIDFGVQLANKKSNLGLYYTPQLHVYNFSDKNNGHETRVQLDLPFEKTLGEKFSFVAGAHASTASLKVSGTKRFSNNLFYFDPSLKVKIPGFLLNIGIIPSWNNKVFKLLPNLTAEMPSKDNLYMIQAGFIGYYSLQTYQRQAILNPWINAPALLRNTENSELFASIKGTADAHFSFKGKVGLIMQKNVPLFVNDNGSGKSFNVLNEAKMSTLNVNGEIAYRMADKFYASVLLDVYKYALQQTHSHPWGLLPYELKGHATLHIAKDFYLKTDLYAFGSSWYRLPNGSGQKTNGATDINAGFEFNVSRKFRVWAQLNNLLNKQYQRWNQYPVFGVQVLGGVQVAF
jgi:hypothetical protein